MLRSTLLLATVLVVAAGTARAEETRRFAGMTLTDALLALQAEGLEILFTSEVVRPDMRVTAEPTGDTPRAILDQLLAAHGLEVRASPEGTLVVVPGPAPAAAIEGRVLERYSGRPLGDVEILIPAAGLETRSGPDGRFALPDVPPGSYVLEARRPGFVVARLRDVTAVAGSVRELAVELVPTPIPLDEIVVTPSQVSLLLAEPVAPFVLERDEIAALPHLGDDLMRTLTLLPGTAGNELSAQFSVRGGRPDEVLVMLDQLELFEPFHLRDFQNALSIIAPRAIAEVDLILGGYPARFGDRMGGVLDMRTVQPEQRKSHLGFALPGVQAGSAGTFAERRASWLAVARYGSFELLRSFLSQDERPRYGDAFGKLEYRLGDRHRLGARTLFAEDRMSFTIVDSGDSERVSTAYGSRYVWLTHQALLGSRAFVDTVLSSGRIDRDRRAVETEGEVEGFSLHDERQLDVVGLKQDWNLHLGGNADGASEHYLRFGFDVRSLEADYDYLNLRQLDDTFDPIRSEPRTGTTALARAVDGEHYGVYVSDRLRPWRKLTAEIGLRYDQHTATRDRDLSPRLNLVLALGPRSTLRAAWGHYSQSQRIYELRVEDGESDFFPSELTEQLVLGLEHVFGGGVSMRLDLYDRDVENPRPRYENVFEPISSFPEIEPDRVRFAPVRSTAEGLELFVRGRRGGKLEWWVNYTYARVRDQIDGRQQRRSVDQPHALNADLNVRFDERWSLNLAFRYHTGWPTTAIGGRLEEGDDGTFEPVPVFGPINAGRLSDYHRLDLRVSRRWQLERGALSFFLDLQNLYDRENQAGVNVDFELVVRDDGRVDAITFDELWGGLLPSFGIEWEF